MNFDENTTSALTCSQGAAVAFAQNTRDEVRLQGGDGQIVGALAAEPGVKQTSYIAVPMNIYDGNKRADRPEGGFYVRMDEDTGKTLDAATGLNPTCSQGGTAILSPPAFAFDPYNQACAPVTHTLRKGRSATGDEIPQTVTAMQVRRLTPTECERLQGFPDGYTNIPWRNQPTSPDGPRYKALGNSWAVPNVRWIGERINEELLKCN